MKRSAAFTLIEIILVIAIIAMAYYVAIPQFNLATGAEVSVKLGQLAGDIRSGYDTAVLSGHTHRMVFELASGEYWLESSNQSDVRLGVDKARHDITEEEEKSKSGEFEDRFKEYEDLAGQEVTDPETEEKIKPTSPLLMAKSQLKPVSWERIDTVEWQGRSVGPYLLFQDIQAEHHETKQTLEDLGEKGRAVIYFLPAGYTERAVLHVAFKRGALEVDPDKEPFSVITSPYDGTAEVVSGYVEYSEVAERS
jgi:prepilin-type N-terminal cleavage/methylation domain-containing protein